MLTTSLSYGLREYQPLNSLHYSNSLHWRYINNIKRLCSIDPESNGNNLWDYFFTLQVKSCSETYLATFTLTCTGSQLRYYHEFIVKLGLLTRDWHSSPGSGNQKQSLTASVCNLDKFMFSWSQGFFCFPTPK